MKHILQLVLTLFISFSSFSQVCVHSITNATPLQGTNGTQVTINGTNFTASSTVSINGNPASSVTFIDANTLIASVANGTTSGPIEVTDSSCTTTFGTFTELNDSNSCSVMFSDIIISEVFDNNGGSLGYIEVFNGTGSPVNLSNYTIDRYGDLSTTTVTHTYTFPNGLIIQDQEALVGRINSGGSGIEDFDYENTTNGFNADDRLELFNNGTLIDDFHDEIDGTVGYVYRRNTDISGPNPNFTTSEWTTFTEGDESDLGIYNASSIPPLINTQPSDSSDCTASFSVSATASNGGMLSYQWYFNENNGSNTNFIEVNSTNLPSVTISGETSTMLTLTGNTISIDNYQFFVLITEVGGCSSYSDTAIFTYQDNIAPVPDITPLATLTDQCQIDMLTAPTATDNCVGSVTGTTTTTTPITSSTTITWTYTDANGNSSTQDQDVVINDTTAPVADNDPLPTVNEECQVDSIAAPTATDNCDGQVTGTTTTPFPITSSTTVTWTYTDANGNSSTQDQDVLINFPQIDSMANVNECQSFTLPTITGSNLSGNEMYYTGSNGAGTSYSSGTVLNFEDFQNYPVTLYIYDEVLTTPSCFSEETFTLTLQDCEPPVILPPNEILIPEFLTPNNDGFNDVWNVRNVFTIDPKAQVYIFDRYGKLLKALSQSEPFWDGTFHGKQMPSNDYWYLVQLINEDSSGLPMSQQLKGHFTLKR
ncbi:T9SS type B sorting domain-containing protein [Croceibacter atlanticus]|uniref:T9SS type B sorting domain-containing protein n=1 Tax=Croceibacter atlanticus TaxID=313588 RepID=UPI0032B2638E